MNQMVENFMKIMGDQPLSLSLVAVILLLIWFLFKSSSAYESGRRETVALMVNWQKESQTIMANCVSQENLGMIISALERDRQTYRAMLPTFPGQPAAHVDQTQPAQPADIGK